MWISMGPRNVSGRGRSLSVHPTNRDWVYVGAETGGIWKSVDGGKSWKPLMFHEESLNIGSFAVAYNLTSPSNNIIYAGTGVHLSDSVTPTEPNAFSGVGLYVSNNDGASWTLRPNMVNRAVTRVLVSTTDAEKVYVGGKSGFERSVDGGNTWETMITGPISDALLDPADPNTIFVCVHNGSLQKITLRSAGSHTSAMGNYDLETITTPVGTLAWCRLAIGVSGTHTSNFLLLKTADGVIYKSTNQGGAWTMMSGIHGPANSSPTSPGTHNTIAVSPVDENIILAGGQIFDATDDGGAMWHPISSMHPDHHAVVFSPSHPDTVYAVNDGGVYRSDDHGLHWSHVSNGLVNTQFYATGSWRMLSTVLGGGLQDNGVFFTTGGLTWTVELGGDGGYFAVHGTDPTIRYGSSYDQIYETSAGGVGSWSDTSASLDTNRPWLLIIAEDPTNPDRIYTGTTRVYRHTGIAASPWQPCSQVISTNRFTKAIQAIAVAPSDGNRIYAGTGGYSLLSGEGTGNLYRTMDGGATDWTDITGSLPSSRPVSDIAVDETNANRLVVSFGGINGGSSSARHVFLCENGGAAASSIVWTDISFDLPNRSVNGVAIDPSDPNVVYAGTDVGMFRLHIPSATWTPFNAGLPKVIIRDLHVTRESTSRIMLYAATFGRGVYKTNITPGHTTPNVDVYLRDNVLDTGEVTPSPSDLPDPLHPPERVYFWQSPDIKIDNSPFQFSYSYTMDGVEFDEVLQHEDPIRTEINRFYLQLHNRGPQPANGVIARAFYCDACFGLPPLPHSLSPVDNFNLTDETHWHPLDAAVTGLTLQPNQPLIVKWDYLIPEEMADHSCLIAVVSSNEDPFTSTETNLAILAPQDKHICQKNLHVIYRDGTESHRCMMMMMLHNASDEDDLIDLILDGDEFGDGSVGLMLEPFEFVDAQSALKEVEVVQLARNESPGDWYERPWKRLRQTRRDLKATGDERWKNVDQSMLFAFALSQKPELRGIKMRGRQSLQVVLLFHTFQEFPTEEPRRFNMMQRQGGRIVGGSTFEIRKMKKAAAVKPVSRIRITLEKIKITDDREPWFKGRGEFRFRADVSFNESRSRRHISLMPEKGYFKLGDWEGANEKVLDVCLFDGYVAEDDAMTLTISGVEADLFDPDDALALYRRKFPAGPETWVGSYAPDDEPAAADKESLPDWQLWYRIDSLPI
jgi:photosystem II stability/assembly factor-like uncharacterized protein